jgi:hypothetical protein
MSAFDALTKIKQAVTHPKTDHTLPKSRSLAFKAITEKAALQGTKGQHCTLVHGDHWNEVKGNQRENIKKNHHQTVNGNSNISIDGTHEKKIMKGYNRNVIGPELTVNIAPKVSTFVEPFTELHSSPHTENSDDLFEVKFFAGEWHSIHFEAHDLDISIHPFEYELAVHHFEIHELETKVDVTKFGLHFLKAETGGFRNTFNAFWNEVSGAGAQARAAQANVGPDVQQPPVSLPGVR